MRKRLLVLLFASAAAAAIACGQISDRYGSTTAMPASGISPWYKIDMDTETDLVQSFILVAEAGQYLTEPSYLIVDDRHHLFFEVKEYDPDADTVSASYIAYAVSDDGINWEYANGGDPVLIADQTWEGAGVGGPSVLYDDGRFVMLYAGFAGAGFGFAESEDGINWDKAPANPVVVPDQNWEEGVIAAPSIWLQDGNYRMAYSGGAVDGPAVARYQGHSIGYAGSSDGIHWLKKDQDGRTSETQPGKVRPILSPDQGWEGYDSATGATGAMSSPCLRIDHPVDRDVWRLYYTGNLQGDPVLVDTGIGYAGSFDGVEWEKLEDAFNPILSERFPLTLFGVTEYVAYGEAAPSVIKKGNAYRMIFAQTDLLGTQQGLAIAAHPRAD